MKEVSLVKSLKNALNDKRIEGYRLGQSHAQSTCLKNDPNIRKTYQQHQSEFEASCIAARNVTDGEVLKRIKKVKRDSGADHPNSEATAQGEGWNCWVWTFWHEFYNRTGMIPQHVTRQIGRWSQEVPGTIEMEGIPGRMEFDMATGEVGMSTDQAKVFKSLYPGAEIIREVVQ